MATHSSTLAWKFHGWRGLVGYSPRGHKESDTTERLHLNSARVTFRLARKSSLTSSLSVSLRIMHVGTALHSLCNFAASIKKDSFEQRCRRLSHQRQGQACAEVGWGAFLDSPGVTTLPGERSPRPQLW